MAGLTVGPGSGAGQQLAALARDLRVAKDRDLQKALYAGLGRATKPIRAMALADTERLPKGGGRGVRSYNQKTGKAQAKLKKRGYAYQAPVATGRTRVESLQARAKKARFRVKTKSSRNVVGLRLTALPAKGSSVNLNNLDDGYVEHPRFGDRRHWHRQSVPAGWFSDAVIANGSKVREECLAAVDEVTAKLKAKG